MSFTIVDCEQRSREWFAARAGLLTASEAAEMLSAPKKNGEEAAGKAELRLRLALESLRGIPLEEPRYESDYMRRGREREADALAAYEASTGEIVERVGFVRHETLPIGCSPDGLVGEAGGVEVKAPKFTTHFDYLRRGRLPAEYTPQILHSLFVTGFDWWDFCSFCPEFEGRARLFIVRVWRADVDLDGYALAFNLFWSEVEHVKETVRALSAPEMACAE